MPQTDPTAVLKRLKALCAAAPGGDVDHALFELNYLRQQLGDAQADKARLDWVQARRKSLEYVKLSECGGYVWYRDGHEDKDIRRVIDAARGGQQ